MDRKSIGILTYYWPPSGGSGVQRWLRFSNHLAELGWEVHVFTFENPQFEVIDNDNIDLVNPSIKVNKMKGFEPSKFLKSLFTYKSKFRSYSDGIGFRHDNNSITSAVIRELLFFPDARKFLIGPAYRFIKKYFHISRFSYLSNF